jgi:hypothetical protein
MERCQISNCCYRHRFWANFRNAFYRQKTVCFFMDFGEYFFRNVIKLFYALAEAENIIANTPPSRKIKNVTPPFGCRITRFAFWRAFIEQQI